MTLSYLDQSTVSKIEPVRTKTSSKDGVWDAASEHEIVPFFQTIADFCISCILTNQQRKISFLTEEKAAITIRAMHKAQFITGSVEILVAIEKTF